MRSAMALVSVVALLGALTLLASRAQAQATTGKNAARRAEGKMAPAVGAADDSRRAVAGESQGVDKKVAPEKGAATLAASRSNTPNRENRTEMVPMRDGVRLATDVYWPQDGEGPWPAIVVRTPYNRQSRRNPGRLGEYLSAGYALVFQDWRGTYDSEGQFTGSFEGMFPGATGQTNDSWDTVEWVARQPWCNGKVGMTGSSASGIASKVTVQAGAPHLVAATPSMSGGRALHTRRINGGVIRTDSDGWLANQGCEVAKWPKPRTFFPEDVPTGRRVESAASRAAVLDQDGWYDMFCQSALDDFVALAPNNPNYRLIITAQAHGRKPGGLEYPPNAEAPEESRKWFDHWLKGADNDVMSLPRMRYYLMGDVRDPGAPGNVWKQADSWPIPCTPTSYFFTKNGGLDSGPPADKEATVGFAYDPGNPIPTLGGTGGVGSGVKGPVDQRALKDRADILRFATEPLNEPVEITGKVFVELFIDTDVPDTTFMAKLIDIYPDGYEALMVDSALMARYWNGFDHPAPLEKGKVYKLTIDLFSTALVFNKGHRIAIHVAGSNTPRYEVHPNSYEPVFSYDNAPVAHNRVHVSREHPSRLILPVIAPGVSKDYRSDTQSQTAGGGR